MLRESDDLLALQEFERYGAYTRVRNTSWSILQKSRQTAFPLSVRAFAAVCGKPVKIVKNSDVQELKRNESGVSVYDGGKWFIIYDDLLPAAEKRFVIAHELGHIIMGHELVPHPLGACSKTRNIRQEGEAETFAYRILAPACVLWGLQIHTAAEISRLCNISLEKARIRADRMRVLYRRDCFLKSEKERQVFLQFEPYIRHMQQERGITFDFTRYLQNRR